MRVNERSQFLVAPELAYGRFGILRVVPKDAHVLFDITLLDCVLADAARDYQSLVRSNDAPQSVEESLKLKMDAAKQLFLVGNGRYQTK